MSKKIEITNKLVDAVKKGGELRDIKDAIVPGFGIRVGANRSTYILLARFPGSSNPTRRAIAQVGAIELKAARKIASEWKELLIEGVDPAVVVAEKKEAAATKSRDESETFEAVADEYIKLILSQQKKGAEIGRAIKATFCPTLEGRSIGKITTRDITGPIKAKAVTHKAQAYFILGYITRMFDWVVSDGRIAVSPCASIKPRTLLGELERREGKQLTEDEVRKIWNAADEMGYPYGPLFRLLLLTGCRHREVSKASWSEFDLKAKLWTIPAKRMKGRKDGDPRQDHVVPLTPLALDLLRNLPRFDDGDFLFSKKNGSEPTWIHTEYKDTMDKLSHVYGWRTHDLRTTVRSYLSPLPIHSNSTVDVRELMIAHKKKGIGKVYDKHDYLDEKREGFQLWHDRLAEIVGLPPVGAPKLKLASSRAS